jgi:hypothetical protein
MTASSAAWTTPVDVNVGAPVAHYADQYKTFDGLAFGHGTAKPVIGRRSSPGLPAGEDRQSAGRPASRSIPPRREASGYGRRSRQR